MPIVPRFLSSDSDGTLVEDAFTVADGATLEVRVGSDDVDFGPGSSHLVLTSGIPVQLGGSLRVVWEPIEFLDLERFPLRGSYDLFDWPGLLEPDNVFSCLELPPGAWDVSQLYTSGQITLIDEYRGNGDFDVNDQLNADDIDQLSAAVRAGRDLSFDVNGDGLLNQDDRRLWVDDLKNTFFGDANLDGMVDAADLNELALNWNGIAAGWGKGDFTGDAIVNAADLNELALNWQAGVNANATSHTIPEPTGIVLAVVGLVVFSVLRRRR